MADNNRMVIELMSLFVGTLCMFFGYKLLMRGVYSATDASAVWSNHSLLIKRSVPGVLFALFGAAVVVAGVLHSTEQRSREVPSAKEEQTEGAKQSSSSAQPPRRKHVRDEEKKQHTAPAQAGTTTPEQSSPEQADQVPSATKTFKPGRT